MIVFILACLCELLYTTCVRCPRRPGFVGSHGNGVLSSYGLSDVGAGNWSLLQE